MRKLAKLVEDINAVSTTGSLAGKVRAGTPIKLVRLLENGSYEFTALWYGEWVTMQTTADLPAATDRGAAARAARASARVTLRAGRPTLSDEVATVRLVCKVTREQYGAVFRKAEAGGLTVPRYVRKLLVDDGMPE